MKKKLNLTNLNHDTVNPDNCVTLSIELEQKVVGAGVLNEKVFLPRTTLRLITSFAGKTPNLISHSCTASIDFTLLSITYWRDETKQAELHFFISAVTRKQSDLLSINTINF